MPTFEEDIVESYYNIQGYFTIKNIQFSAVKKRPGGRGRGEIDLLAIKPNKKGLILDAIHIEVSVGIVYEFPFIDKHYASTDEVRRLLKKFFQNDSDKKIEEYLGKFKCRSVCVTSDFGKRTVDKIKERLDELKVDRFKIIRNGPSKIDVDILYLKKHKILELIPFRYIIDDLVRFLKEKRLLTKDFQNQSLAAMQHFIRLNKKTE